MNSKLNILFIIAFLPLFNIVAQSKLKGNKIVITQNREAANFTAIEVMNDIDVYLFQGTSPYINVEADENLQEAIQTKIEGNTLKIFLSNDIKSSKKLNVLVTVTDSLNLITARANSNIYADNRLILRALTVNAYDNSDFELKLDADNFTVNGYKNTDLKLDVFSVNATANISESCELKLEGEIENLTSDIKNSSVLTVKGKGKKSLITAQNNSTFKGDNFKVDETIVIANSRTDIYVNTNNKLSITATDSAEITSYGKPEIELVKFEVRAKLHKK